METFIKQHKDVLFRYWVYRKPGLFTPYEQDRCFMDESIFEDTFANFGYISSFVETSDGVLLEFEQTDEDGEKMGIRDYQFLKNIHLACYDFDNCEEDEDAELSQTH